MLSWSRVLAFGLQACPGCGSYLGGRGLLCQPCEALVLRKAGAHVDVVDGLLVRSLFLWEPGESDVLSALLLALKGPYQQRAWRYWAEVFSQAHGAGLPLGPWSALSAPSAKSSMSQDHADHWGEALADLHALPFAGKTFAREGSGHRFLSREKRLRDRRLVKLTEEPLAHGAAWVMMDDILTTGATAKAVYHVLRSPRHFEVWCLARRTHISCAASGSMLRLGELKGFQI